MFVDLKTSDWIPNPSYLNKIKLTTLRRWNAELVGTVLYDLSRTNHR